MGVLGEFTHILPHKVCIHVISTTGGDMCVHHTTLLCGWQCGCVGRVPTHSPAHSATSDTGGDVCVHHSTFFCGVQCGCVG